MNYQNINNYEIKRIQDFISSIENSSKDRTYIKHEEDIINKKVLYLNDFILTTAGEMYLNEEQLIKLRDLSISKGGFINNNIRKVIWKKLLCVEHSKLTTNNLKINQINFKILKFKVSTKNEFYIEESLEKINITTPNFNYFSNLKNISNNEIKKKIDFNINNAQIDLIKNDINRSVICHFNIFNSKKENTGDEKYEYETNLIKSHLFDLLKNIFNLKSVHYDYYQGFHDLSLFIYIVFPENKKVALSILQRIIELFLKDYLNSNLLYDKVKNIGIDMHKELNSNNKNIFNTVVTILFNTIKKIDPEAFNLIENQGETDFVYLCVSWIICLFTQKNSDLNTSLRILDYIICSNPIVIYYMVANVSLIFL